MSLENRRLRWAVAELSAHLPDATLAWFGEAETWPSRTRVRGIWHQKIAVLPLLDWIDHLSFQSSRCFGTLLCFCSPFCQVQAGPLSRDLQWEAQHGAMEESVRMDEVQEFKEPTFCFDSVFVTHALNCF